MQYRYVMPWPVVDRMWACFCLLTRFLFTLQQPEDHAVVNPTNNRNNNRNSHMYDVSLSEESSGGWVSEESEDDFVNAAPSESGTSIAGWSMSQNDVYLTSQPSQQSMV